MQKLKGARSSQFTYLSSSLMSASLNLGGSGLLRVGKWVKFHVLNGAPTVLLDPNLWFLVFITKSLKCVNFVIGLFEFERECFFFIPNLDLGLSYTFTKLPRSSSLVSLDIKLGVKYQSDDSLEFLELELRDFFL